MRYIATKTKIFDTKNNLLLCGAFVDTAGQQNNGIYFQQLSVKFSYYTVSDSLNPGSEKTMLLVLRT